MWTVLRQAHTGPANEAAAAKELLLARYGGAARRYLLGLLRDPHTADDLTQEFAIRLLSGGFHSADPSKGRFRNYVKTTLFHLVSAHMRKRKHTPNPVSPEDLLAVEPAVDHSAEIDKAFDDAWRSELLARTWASLAAANPTYYAVLRARASHPELPSDQLAPKVSEQLGKPFSPANLRQTLKRSRELFAQLLLDEVAHSIDDPTPEMIDEELAELNLLQYVKQDR